MRSRDLFSEENCRDMDNYAEQMKDRQLERSVMARPVATYWQARAAVANQALQDADEGLAPRVIKARAKELADGFALFPDERDEIVMEAMMSVASRAA